MTQLTTDALRERTDESLGVELFDARKCRVDDEGCEARAAISEELARRGHDAFAFSDRVGEAYERERARRITGAFRKRALAAWADLDDVAKGHAMMDWFARAHPRALEDIRRSVTQAMRSWSPAAE